MPGHFLYVVIPGDIDTRTGGYEYDRQVMAGLRARGWTVAHVGLRGSYPFPSREDRAEAARTLAAIPDGSLVLVDGLAFGTLAAEAKHEQSRLQLVALVHHPLGHETGIGVEATETLLASEREALSAARGVVVTSQRTVAAVEELGVAREQIVVAEPGTVPAPLATGSVSGSLHMLCVASLVPRKGHDTLFDALLNLSDLDWSLTCVGGLDRDPAWAAGLAERCEVAPLAGRVVLAGELAGEELEAAYDQADLFVLPTHYEGYGMVVAEALARGIPVVGTRTGAIAELVGDSAGVLVPVGDADALAATVRQLLTDREELTRLRRGARRVRSSLPTWATTCQLLEKALVQVVSR